MAIDLFATFLVFAAIGLTSVITRKRVQPHPLQAKLQIVVFFASMSVFPIAAAARLAAPPLVVMLVVQFVLIVTIDSWPRWPELPPPVEFRVRRAASGTDDGANFLTMTVPNESLGLSTVVVSRAPADPSVAPSPRLEDPIIERTFTPHDTIRVSALVNIGARPLTARVELVDFHGRIAFQAVNEIRKEALVQQVTSWDELADHDAAEHFGQVDVRLPFGGVAPGAYCLRVTVHDGFTLRMQEEVLHVAAAG